MSTIERPCGDCKVMTSLSDLRTIWGHYPPRPLFDVCPECLAVRREGEFES